MASMTCARRFGRVALLILGVAVVSCSNPPGRVLDPNAERTVAAGPSAYPIELALDDIAKVVEPAWTTDDPVRDAPAPAPRDWLKNLVGQGGKSDPGAPAP